MLYGVFITLALLISLLLGERLVKKRDLSIDIFWSASFWTIICGLIGARIYHVIDYYQYYSANPIKILYFHEGGLGIYGAIVGGIIGLILSLRRNNELKKYDYLEWTDVVAIVMPLGQAIGRVGNFFNHELYGLPTNLPWGLYIPPQFRPSDYINNDYFHPLFAYESILNFTLFLILWTVFSSRGDFDGDETKRAGMTSSSGFYTFAYFSGYGFIRFCLEFLRINSWKLFSINVAQLLSLFFMVFGIYMLFSHKAKKA